MSVSETKPRTQQRKNAYLIAACVTLGVYVALMISSQWIGQGVVPVALAFAVLAFVLSLLWFGALDELAQRAHYEAWFWGGAIGLMTLPVAAVTSIVAHDAWSDFVHGIAGRFWGSADVADGFTLGMAAAVIPPGLGYTIWWLVFWLRRR